MPQCQKVGMDSWTQAMDSACDTEATVLGEHTLSEIKTGWEGVLQEP